MTNVPPPISRTELFDTLADVIKAMANGKRLGLLEILAQGEYSVDELATLSSLGITSTSAHLQILKQAGLVRTRREGNSIFYRIASDDVALLFDVAKSVGINHHPEVREQLDEYMQQIAAEQPVELVDALDVTPNMLVIDVRPTHEYEAAHFPGSISLPLENLEQRFKEIPADADIVLYCRGEFCRKAREAAAWLRDRGYQARAMDEGMLEWRANREIYVDVA